MFHFIQKKSASSGQIAEVHKPKTEEQERSHWIRIIFLTQLIIAVCIFITEIVDNALLYITRSQGYGPDNIVQKLLRYLVLTSVINFSATITSQIIIRRSKNFEFIKRVLMLTTIIICTNVAYSHYQFPSTLCIFVIPVTICIIFEDAKLSRMTYFLCLAGLALAISAKARDPLYNQDIIPEAAIDFMILTSIYIFSTIIRSTLSGLKQDLANSLVTEERVKSAEAQQQLSLKMLATLARAIDAKDKYTNGHSERVAAYAVMLARELGLAEEEINLLRYEALLHDIGKIGVPDSILNKPARLTDIEFKIIQSHTLVGANILKDMVVIPDANIVAKFHHEKFDGRGYPAGLSAENIPLHARIVGITDAYDAMNSDRIYRKALSRDIIREELEKGRGTQFDPVCLDAFLRLFDAGKLASELHSNEFEDTEFSETNNDILTDISNVIYSINTQNSLSDFQNLYKYMRNIGSRYKRSVEVLSLVAEPLSENEAKEAFDVANDKLRIAIRKNIRSVDVHYERDVCSHLVILLDAGTENIDVIVNRIRFDFSKEMTSNTFQLTYKLNEDINLE